MSERWLGGFGLAVAAGDPVQHGRLDRVGPDRVHADAVGGGFHDKQTLVHDVIAWQAEATLDQHRAPELDGFQTFASFRLWADLITQRQRQRQCQGGCNFVQGGMLLTQPLRTTEPLEAAFTAALARLASFASDPAEAARTLRLGGG